MCVKSLMENETGVSQWSPRFGRWYVCDKVVHILFMTCTTRFYWLNQNAVIKLDAKAFRNVTKENRVGVIKRTIKFVGTFASRLGLEIREIPRLSQYLRCIVVHVKLSAVRFLSSERFVCTSTYSMQYRFACFIRLSSAKLIVTRYCFEEYLIRRFVVPPVFTIDGLLEEKIKDRM